MATTAFQANRLLPLKDDDVAALCVRPNYPTSRAPAILADACAILLNC